MTNRRRVLDLFCGQGGASAGYVAAGCEVLGVDIEPQPHYRYPFLQADALIVSLEGFDLIHASPPRQAWSASTAQFRVKGREYPKLIESVRERLIVSGIPFIIENVVGAPLINPVLLCGTMFGLGVYRHRLFEASFPLAPPPHPPHPSPVAKLGRKPGAGQFRSVAGHAVDVAGVRHDMGHMTWMTVGGASQAIPWAYTHWIASQDGTRPCQVCGRWWSPRRRDAKTCSAACRKALSRAPR